MSLEINIAPHGVRAAELEELRIRLYEERAVRARLKGRRHRLLSLELLESDAKTAEPPLPPDLRATFFDYERNKCVTVSGPLDLRGGLKIRESTRQPLPTTAEFEEAVDLLGGDLQLGPLVRSGTLLPYRAMPPLAPSVRRDSNRALSVGLLPPKASRAAVHEIVTVDLITRKVFRHEGGAPRPSRVGERLCGQPPSAHQSLTDKGVPGQAWITVTDGGEEIWRLLAVRPSASSGAFGSGVELRYVDYRGRRLLHRAHTPIVNVEYDMNACGPFRDWVYEEGMLEAEGRVMAPGFLLARRPAETIVETGSDKGNHLGVAIYAEGTDVVLVSELQSGWYRYANEWRLTKDGVVSPRFGFAGTANSCICYRHSHHVYWRLDFDIVSAKGNEVRVGSSPESTRAIARESKHLRESDRRWFVGHSGAGVWYEIVPGRQDGTAGGDDYAKGDLWFVRYRSSELDDQPSPDTSANIDRFARGLELRGQDLVVWYAAHFTHAAREDFQRRPTRARIGPSIVPAIL